MIAVGEENGHALLGDVEVHFDGPTAAGNSGLIRKLLIIDRPAANDQGPTALATRTGARASPRALGPIMLGPTLPIVTIFGKTVRRPLRATLRNELIRGPRPFSPNSPLEAQLFRDKPRLRTKFTTTRAP